MWEHTVEEMTCLKAFLPDFYREESTRYSTVQYNKNKMAIIPLIVIFLVEMGRATSTGIEKFNWEENTFSICLQTHLLLIHTYHPTNVNIPTLTIQLFNY